MSQCFFKRIAFFSTLLLALTALIPVSFSQDDTPTTPSEKQPVTAPRNLPYPTVRDQSRAEVEAVADTLEYQKDSRKLVARGNAVVTHQNIKLLADYAEVETETKKSFAKGHVIIFENETPILTGDEVYYNFSTRQASMPGAKAIQTPWYARGEEVQQVKQGEIHVRHGGVTTCNLENPHYEIRCKKATLYSGVKIRMVNVTIHVLGKPVFWLPYLEVPLNWNIPFQVRVGSSDQYGTYIELSKGITFNKYLSGKWHADWRSKRGFGGGWDQNYDFGKYAKGDVKLYWTQDKRAPTPNHYEAGGKLNPYELREDRDRGRITWRHRTDFSEYTNIIMRYHRVADGYFLKDFAENEYRAEMEPHSFVTATHNTQRWGAMVHAEKKMNSHENIIERLPQVRLDWKNQPLMGDKVYNVSRLQFDNLGKKIGYSDYNEDVIRVDGYSRLIAPVKLGDVKMTPYLGYRATEYSRDLRTDGAHFRQVLEYGLDVRTQAYKTFDVTFEKAGIEVNQLRHIFEPNVRVQGTDSTLSYEKIAHFDTVDMIDDASEIVFGMDNRLQTKRVANGRNQRVDIVSMNTYAHFAISPQDPNIQGAKFTLVENELTLRPYDWLQFQHRLEYDAARNYIKRCNNDIVIRHQRLKLTFGHRFIHRQYDYTQNLDIDTSQQFVFDGEYKLNDLWTLAGYIRWDQKGSSLQEWQVSASRDLHDFILDFGYNVRDSLINSKNNELFFNFRMKDFPGMDFGLGGGRATFSPPRIGETVEGASQDRSLLSKSF